MEEKKSFFFLPVCLVKTKAFEVDTKNFREGKERYRFLCLKINNNQ